MGARSMITLFQRLLLFQITRKEPGETEAYFFKYFCKYIAPRIFLLGK